MKFLIDAQLPPSLVPVLLRAGHDAIHTLSLPNRNNTTDLEVLRVCQEQTRVLITKDSDFLGTYLLRREPTKLLIITTGNVSNLTLFRLIEENLENICFLFSENAVIELSRQELTVHF